MKSVTCQKYHFKNICVLINLLVVFPTSSIKAWACLTVLRHQKYSNTVLGGASRDGGQVHVEACLPACFYVIMFSLDNCTSLCTSRSWCIPVQKRILHRWLGKMWWKIRLRRQQRRGELSSRWEHYCLQATGNMKTKLIQECVYMRMKNLDTTVYYPVDYAVHSVR